ncbi:Alpha/Beta hydrolase protein [Xylaria bambusicola]|uniref:Alpha/Beta hydrolase protein n=1 Tax=Xylaria bambusicola TaxID=326684 RepID=UPI002007221F|nr:Alpha/Beta hydrolase protein [Xylaria bambusicola]KAI0521991.1 Alpha/Beta hydrolase protein [Xylaria bambusicola]
MTLSSHEGEVAFDAPEANKPCKTWYKIYGDLSSHRGPALVALHGGPGAGHEYLSPLTDIYEKYDIPIVFYDQVGCGRSTHFREKYGDTNFWTFELFIKELDNLVDHLQLREKGFFILGQSWGGMLGGAYAALKPKGLRKLVLAGSPASIPLMLKGSRELLAALPEPARTTLEECDKKGDHESEEFENAAKEFYGRHVCRLDPYPEDVLCAFKNLKDDPSAYHTMQGPSEFVIVGSFKDWEGWQEAHNIEVETLLLNGRYDEVTDQSVLPWFRHIPKVKWVTLENSSHMSHWEDRERFMQIVGEFLSWSV